MAEETIKVAGYCFRCNRPLQPTELLQLPDVICSGCGFAEPTCDCAPVQIGDNPPRCSCGVPLQPLTMEYGDGPYFEEVTEGWVSGPDYRDFAEDIRAANYPEYDRVSAEDVAEVNRYINGGWVPVHDILNDDGSVRQAGSHLGCDPPVAVAPAE